MGDIFNDPYPEGHDAVLFANQLVIWSPEQNRDLLRKAHAALPEGGRVMVFNVMSGDTGDGPLYSALDNAYFATLTRAAQHDLQLEPLRAVDARDGVRRGAQASRGDLDPARGDQRDQAGPRRELSRGSGRGAHTAPARTREPRAPEPRAPRSEPRAPGPGFRVLGSEF
ncbi:methyltransferase [Streptosporangium vulgare]|uniref:methyltransferase n=1 Tax=Streptosporangium vulgare TaxID=46190 RepID=UPI0031D81FD2